MYTHVGEFMDRWFFTAISLLFSSLAWSADLNVQYNCHNGFSGSANSQCVQFSQELAKAYFNFGVSDAVLSELGRKGHHSLIQAWKDVNGYANGAGACNEVGMTTLLKSQNIDLLNETPFRLALDNIKKLGQKVKTSDPSQRELSIIENNKLVLMSYCKKL